MASFKAISSYSVAGTFRDTSLDHTTPTSRIGVNLLKTYTSGTGANQANQWWADQRTLVATSENLDLYGGLTDAFGTTINFVTIREIVIKNRNTANAELLDISGNALDNVLLGTSASQRIGGGGIWVVSFPLGGFGITAGSGDILTIDALTNTVTYDIFLIGTV